MKIRAKKNVKLKDPDSITFTGSQFLEKPSIQIIEYCDDFYSEKKDLKFEELYDLAKTDRVYWLNLHGIHDTDLVKMICKKYRIHSMIAEDILDVTQRPKIQEIKGQLYFMVKSILPGDDAQLEIEHISFILGKNYVISFQEKIKDHFEHIRHRLREKKGQVREKGSDYLLYLLLEAVLDNYRITIDKYDDKVTDLLSSLYKFVQDQSALVKIEKMKEDLRQMKKAMSPIKEALSSIEVGGYELIDENESKYFFDLRNECMMTLDNIEENLQKLESAVNLYFSLQTHKTNIIIKTLTIVSTIFIPLTFIVGVYGMNFDNLPEIHMKYAYFVVWGIMLAIVGVMLYKFRKNKWF